MDQVEGERSAKSRCFNCCEEKEKFYDHIIEAVSVLKEKIPKHPTIGIICGSGLGSIASILTKSISIKYEDIPHFPATKVDGHAGQVVFGDIEGCFAVCMQGRPHFYEGYPLWKCTMPVHIMKSLGITHIIITNAVGAINRDYKVGDIMLVKDHLNLMGIAGISPISEDERFGPKFLTLTDAYDRDLIQIAKETAREEGMEDIIREGVLTCVGGPCFETVTECRMFSLLGVDAVGMSNVPEVIVAKHCGLTVLSFSLITNKNSLDHDYYCGTISHESVLDVGTSRSDILKKFVKGIVKRIKQKQ